MIVFAMLQDFRDIIGDTMFSELAFLLLIAGVLGLALSRLRQPLIIGFIAAGLLAGPDALFLAGRDAHHIDTLATLGIALLLFMVGLKLDPGLIRTLGPAALLTGTVQVFVTSICGTALGLMMGYDFIPSALVGISLSFSSTIIVVKLLSDQRAIDSLHGKISLGILIVQDLFVVLCMIGMAGMSADPENSNFTIQILLFLPARLFALVALGFLFVRYMSVSLSHALLRSPELTVILSMGIAATFAEISDRLGLSRELGGLLAGMALAAAPGREILIARLAPLRDFLLLFFFVMLGTHLHFREIPDMIGPALVLSGFVLLGKPLIVMLIARMLGYRKRTGFMTGVSLAQISEFSLIALTMAASRGLVGEDLAGTMTIVGILTIALSTYGILNASKIYTALEHRLGFFEKDNAGRFEDLLHEARAKKHYDAILIGLGRYGLSIAEKLIDNNVKVLGVDFDPQAVHAAQNADIPAIYGDAMNPALAEMLPLESVRIVICAFPHHMMEAPGLNDLRIAATRALREKGFRGKIAVTSHAPLRESALIEAGADIILHPFDDAAHGAAEKILEAAKKENAEECPFAAAIHKSPVSGI